MNLLKTKKTSMMTLSRCFRKTTCYTFIIMLFTIQKLSTEKSAIKIIPKKCLRLIHHIPYLPTSICIFWQNFLKSNKEKNTRFSILSAKNGIERKQIRNGWVKSSDIDMLSFFPFSAKTKVQKLKPAAFIWSNEGDRMAENVIMLLFMWISHIWWIILIIPYYPVRFKYLVSSIRKGILGICFWMHCQHIEL